MYIYFWIQIRNILHSCVLLKYCEHAKDLQTINNINKKRVHATLSKKGNAVGKMMSKRIEGILFDDISLTNIASCLYDSLILYSDISPSTVIICIRWKSEWEKCYHTYFWLNHYDAPTESGTQGNARGSRKYSYWSKKIYAFWQSLLRIYNESPTVHKH